MVEKDRKRRRGKRQAIVGNEIITLENVSKAYATAAPGKDESMILLKELPNVMP